MHMYIPSSAWLFMYIHIHNYTRLSVVSAIHSKFKLGDCLQLLWFMYTFTNLVYTQVVLQLLQTQKPMDCHWNVSFSSYIHADTWGNAASNEHVHSLSHIVIHVVTVIHRHCLDWQKIWKQRITLQPLLQAVQSVRLQADNLTHTLTT